LSVLLIFVLGRNVCPADDHGGGEIRNTGERRLCCTSTLPIRSYPAPSLFIYFARIQPNKPSKPSPSINSNWWLAH
jgi:hypothetical protein